MNAIFSVNNTITSKIFNNENIFLFKDPFPKNINKDDIIYLFENRQNDGKRMIVGEVLFDEIMELHPNGEKPMFGAWNFIDYYMETIEKDIIKADLFREAKKHNLPEYKFGCLIGYALSPYYMEQIKKGKYPKYNFRETKENDLAKQGDRYIEKCDRWLREIGYYNDDDCAYWEKAIKIKSPIKYPYLIPINEFRNKNGEAIIKEPKNWIYTIN